MQCKAQARSGQRCKRHAAKNAKVCRLHGANAGAPKGNTNARTHGAYETLIRAKLTPAEQDAFDAIAPDPTLADELRILRFKLLRLLEPVEREVPVGTMAGVEVVTIELDEVTKAQAIARLVGEIRKTVKELDSSRDDHSLDALTRAIADSRRLASQAIPPDGDV